jgi:phosphoglucosamine mutase
VNVDLTPMLAAEIGLAVATFSNAENVLVGRDTRVSGPMLENALVSGLESAGAIVKCLGVVPTPVLAFLTKRTKADAGVMITASHNPPQYNGVKIFDSDGIAYNEATQDKIERVIHQSRFKLADWPSIGQSLSECQGHLYVEMIEKEVRLHKKWSVLVDPGSGATYSIAPTVLRNVGCKVVTLNAQPDGWFPARNSEPNAQTLVSSANAVKGLKVDVGVAYDGDGDRAAFIDRKGVFADFDRLLAAYAAHVVKNNGGGTVVTTVEASMCVEKMVEAHNGKVVRTKVGDIHISDAIKKEKAIFGGEPCGSWIHPQFQCCPDGILSSVLLLKALEDENKSLAELIAETPQYPILRESFACRDAQKQKALRKIEDNLKSAFPKLKEFSTVDGIRLVLDDAWLLVRASGTEPIIRLTVEGGSLKAAKQIVKRGATVIRNSLERSDK